MVVYLVNKILKVKYYLLFNWGGGGDPPTNIFLHNNSFLATKIEVICGGEGCMHIKDWFNIPSLSNLTI